MKKIICILLALVCVLGLCSCAKTVEGVTVAQILEANDIENLLNKFDNMQYNYAQYDKDDNLKSKSTYFYKYDNYGYLYFNADMTSYGYQELKTFYTVKNGAVYSASSGMTELTVFPNKIKDSENYIKKSIDHFDLDFEDVVKDDGEFYLVKAKKITETYYMYLKHECTYYFDRESLILKKVEMKATDREGDVSYNAEINFEYNVTEPTDTADKYFTNPGEGDAVTTVDVYYPNIEGYQKQTFSALNSTYIRGAQVDGVDYTVYKESACVNQIAVLGDRNEGSTAVYVAPTPTEDESSSQAEAH